MGEVKPIHAIVVSIIAVLVTALVIVLIFMSGPNVRGPPGAPPSGYNQTTIVETAVNHWHNDRTYENSNFISTRSVSESESCLFS